MISPSSNTVLVLPDMISSSSNTCTVLVLPGMISSTAVLVLHVPV